MSRLDNFSNVLNWYFKNLVFSVPDEAIVSWFAYRGRKRRKQREIDINKLKKKKQYPAKVYVLDFCHNKISNCMSHTSGHIIMKFSGFILHKKSFTFIDIRTYFETFWIRE